MNKYETILEAKDLTVMVEYTPTKQNRNSFQTEAELEQQTIKQLVSQGYEYLQIHNSTDLKSNLRKCIEKLNNHKFNNDNEWERFFNDSIKNTNKNADSIQAKTERIQNDYIQNFAADDGNLYNIKLIDKKNIHNNILQVINQYSAEGSSKNRYDITILVNGLPLVQMELKRRGVAIKEAFNQIERYQNESFWSEDGLYEYIQIFIISNGTHSKYYSNTTRFNVIAEQKNKRNAKKLGSNSFEFTSYWADKKNNNITDLVDFTKTFLNKTTLLNILIRYCVFTEDKKLIVMRPYQIAAVEAILSQVKINILNKRCGKIESGGYIWHTTGSGKTLTSFKTAQLLSQLSEFAENIDKVLFVVDRQDLDYQTIKEYDKFQKGAANGNKSTKELTKQLEDSRCKIIVTTIQKLGIFCKRNDKHEIYNKKIVFIFDECHRSQFGELHNIMVKQFKNYAMFGFTGTPIFVENANNQRKQTTENIFGNKLHTYTVVDAIRDKNVLPFKIDYVNTIKEANNNDNNDNNDNNNNDNIKVEAIDDEKILLAPKRIENVVKYIIEHYNQKTFSTRFNSIFAVSSIKAAKLYYSEFKKQQQNLQNLHNLKVAIIYSSCINNDDDDNNNNNNDENYLSDEDSDNTEALEINDRSFLENAITNDYNAIFNTNYGTSAELFPNYYKDISARMKAGQIDILIVVNMFLTGFDAPSLNTLWVDKNLKQHGLIQAFSRTNRILNSVKSYGNIVCFRNLSKNVDDAISLFGDKNASGIAILKTLAQYYNGYDEDNKHFAGYKELVEKLNTQFNLQNINENLLTDESKKHFINLFGNILKIKNILQSFDDFGNENYPKILNDGDLQDYLSVYVDLYNELKTVKEKADVLNDIIFEMELVKQIVVNIDYILKLVKEYYLKNILNSEIILPIEIEKAIKSNPELRPKKELIRQFIENINIYYDAANGDIEKSWEEFKKEQQEKELTELININIDCGNNKYKPLKEPETRELVTKMFRNNINAFELSEKDISSILPKISMIKYNQKRIEAKTIIREKLNNFFLKYCN